MIRDRHQFRAQPAFVLVYCLYGNQNDYTLIGQGLLQIVTDQYMFQYEHYVEVSDKATQQIFLRSRLQSTNQYQKQKSTVIAWSDPQQDVQNHIGISFQDQGTCQMFWRLICSKIGKNYLQINGSQKLEMPHQSNVRQLIEKIKNSYNLVAYHIINSTDFMRAFWQTLQRLNEKQNIHNGMSVLRQLLSNYDPKIMTLILSDPNFQRFLMVYQYECNINFRAYYKQSSPINQQLIKLSSTTVKSIELAMRAKFVKECVINYGKDLMVANMLGQVIKDSQTQALITMIRQGYIETIVQLYKQTRNLNQQKHEQMKQESNEKKQMISKKFLNFFLEAAWVIRLYHIDNTKIIFLNEFYHLGVMQIIGQLINEGHFKAIQILSCIAQLDSTTFLTQLSNNYRNNLSNSIVRSIGKNYSQSIHEQYIFETICFLRSLTGPMLQSKQTFQFINKTIIYIIFSLSNNHKYPERILPLINFYLCQLGASRVIFQYVAKFKIMEYFSDKIGKINEENKKKCIQNKQLHHNQKMLTKSGILQIIRMIRAVLQLNKPQVENKQQDKKQQPEKKKKKKPQLIKQPPQIISKINKYLISSNIFKQCLQYLKINIKTNNIITSSIMQILQTLTTLPYNQFTEFLQQNQFELLPLDKVSSGIVNDKLAFLTRNVNKIKEIKNMKQEVQNVGINENVDIDGKRKKRIHQQVLDQEQQQKYLQRQESERQPSYDSKNGSSSNTKTGLQQQKTQQMESNIQKLIQLKAQIRNKQYEQDQEQKRKREMKERIDKLKAQKKTEQQDMEFNIQGFQDEDQVNKNS